MTIANLGLAVDSSSVIAATPALEKMTAASAKAEAAAESMGRGSASSAALMQKMLAVMESMERDLTVLTHNAIGAGRALEAVGPSAQRGFSGANQAMMMSRNLMFQMVDIGQSLPLLLSGNIYGLQNLGFQVAQIGQMYWGQGGMGAALRDIRGMLLGGAARVWPLTAALAAVGVGVASLTTEINRNQEQQVGWTDVVIASWQLASERIMFFFQPVIDMVAGWWDFVSPYIASGINSLIGSFDLAFRDIQTIWGMLPAALGDVAFQGAQSVIDGVVWMLREAVATINGFITHINAMLPENLRMGGLGAPNSVIPGLDIGNPFAGASADYEQQMLQNRMDVWGTDYIGMIGNRARQVALSRKEDDDTKGTEKAIRGITDEFERLMGKAYGVREAITGVFGDLGSVIANAFRKGGNVAMNILDGILTKIGNVGESLMNAGLNGLLNMGMNAALGALTNSGPGFSYGPNVFSDPWGGLRANGGPVEAGKAYIVGEKKPELFVPRTSGNILPSVPAGMTVNISISGSKQDAAAIANALMPKMRQMIVQYQKNPDR